MGLRYTGAGEGRWLIDVPARDLSDEEAALYGGEASLLASGIYEKADGGKAARASKVNSPSALPAEKEE